MKLPSDITALILQKLGMPDLVSAKQVAYARKLHVIRKQMKDLASDFASCVPSEDRYSDAYFIHNFPTNLAKTMVVVQEIVRRYPELLKEKKFLRVLDIGCGEGAGSYGVFYALKELTRIKHFKIKGVDGSQKMLSRAENLYGYLRHIDPNFRMRLLKRKIGHGYGFARRPTYDIVLCVNSLAEILSGDRIPMRFINSIMHCLNDDGLFIIIEPALKKFSRRLMRLRDELLLHKRAQVLAPCLHAGRCALLRVEARNEWCHQSVTWSPPLFLELINQGLNREIDVLKFAYLVIARRRTHLRRSGGYRVVSQLLKEKGKQRCFLCTPDGRVELARLDRSYSVTNAAFDEIHKGAVVSLKGVLSRKKNHWRVTEQTKVDIVK